MSATIGGATLVTGSDVNEPDIAGIISPGSSADRAGLKVGDVIVEADGIQDPTATQLSDAAKDGSLLVRVRRREGTFYAAMKK